MTERKIYQALGFMSGTSCDAVDVALIETDGHAYVKSLAFESYPYLKSQKEIIEKAFGTSDRDKKVVKKAEKIVTKAHMLAGQKFLDTHKDAKPEIIGFHGQTIYHAPHDNVTIQIGKGEKLANTLGAPVVYDFRQADVKNGGQGAPLIPLYHRALAGDTNQPVAFLNIGGVANLTYINSDTVIAFDTGPGNALINDYMQQKLGVEYDPNGAYAAKGDPSAERLKDWMMHPYFAAAYPKSLDRDAFTPTSIEALSLEDAAATLTAFTALSIKFGLDSLPKHPEKLYVCGGGRHNKTMIDMLRAQYRHSERSTRAGEESQEIHSPQEQSSLAQDDTVQIIDSDTMGWNGDAMEAEGFAYLAVRSMLGLPISLPSTTGCQHDGKGGVLVDPDPDFKPKAFRSPCTSVCEKDKKTGYCLGCGRTKDEIDQWKKDDTAQSWRDEISAQLEDRLIEIGELPTKHASQEAA